MTDDEALRLAPCPFCGGVAEMDTQRGFREIVSGKLSDGVAVYCLSCSADMMLCRPDMRDCSTEDLIFMVREQWNRRHHDAQQRADPLTWDGLTEYQKEAMRDLATAALDAETVVLRAEGVKRVGREASEAMQDAALQLDGWGDGDIMLREIWAAAHDAATDALDGETG